MTNLLEMLSSQLDGENLSKISSQIGADESTTKGALSAALPLLIGALSSNASNGEGADQLSGALSRDHDGSMIESSLSRSSGLNAGYIGKLSSMLASLRWCA